jgi:hypothetical protein
LPEQARGRASADTREREMPVSSNTRTLRAHSRVSVLSSYSRTRARARAGVRSFPFQRQDVQDPPPGHLSSSFNLLSAATIASCFTLRRAIGQPIIALRGSAIFFLSRRSKPRRREDSCGRETATNYYYLSENLRVYNRTRCFIQISIWDAFLQTRQNGFKNARISGLYKSTP